MQHTTQSSFNVDEVRSHFPALASDDIYFDNPGGTQVARETIERMPHMPLIYI